MMIRKLTESRLDRAMAQVKMAQVLESTWINTDAVLVLTGWSTPTLYRRIQSGKFPAPIDRGKWHGGSVLSCLESISNNAHVNCGGDVQ